MIKNHYSADIQSFKNALNLQGTSQEQGQCKKTQKIHRQIRTALFTYRRSFLEHDECIRILWSKDFYGKRSKRRL